MSGDFAKGRRAPCHSLRSFLQIHGSVNSPAHMASRRSLAYRLWRASKVGSQRGRTRLDSVLLCRAQGVKEVQRASLFHHAHRNQMVADVRSAGRILAEDEGCHLR